MICLKSAVKNQIISILPQMSEYLLIINFFYLATPRKIYKLLKQGTKLKKNRARSKKYEANLDILQYSSSTLKSIENYVGTLVFKLLIWFNYDTFWFIELC